MNNYYFLPPNEKIKSEFKSEIKSEPSMSHSNTQLVGIKKNPFGSKKYKFGRSSKQRREKKIKKLFDKLRNETITLDSTDDYTPDANNTVIVLDDTIKQYPQKRKLSDTSIDEQTAPKKEDTKPIRIVESTTEPYNSVQNLKIETSDSVIITDDVVLQKKDSISNSSKKRKVNISDTNIHIQIVSDDNDVSQIKSEPCSSKTPRKKGIAPPINCSTPITKSNTSLVCNNNADSTKNLNADANETKVINRDSFLTIDLTMDSDLSKLQCNTIIDLDNTQESHDCTFVSMSNASSMSGDSQVTVLHRNSTNSKHMNKFVSGIAKLDASEKGKLLEIITEKIFSGCKVQQRLNGNASNAVRTTKNQAVETAENTYIKEVILGEKQSRNSIGSNIYNPEKDAKNKTGLRMIVIDGSNVAMEHGRGRYFSVRGLQICIDYFLKRGHTVKAFVPRFRCKFGKSSEPRLLDELERRGFVVYTPSREIKGKIVSAYDDRYIVQCAAEFDGVIVSGDNYRDLLQENPRWRFVIENRLLPFTWVNDMIMFPRDPLGRNGPTLEQFLRHPAPESVTSIVL